jgi:hypothetical protein
VIDVVSAQITAMEPMSTDVCDTLMPTTTQMEQETRIIEIYEKETGYYELDLVKVDKVPDAKTQDYWDLFEEIPDATVVLPKTKSFKIRSRQEPIALQLSTKIRMEQYPTYARPSMTNKFAEEFNSVSKRQGSCPQYVVKTSTVDIEYTLFKSNYYRADKEKRIAHYKNNPLSISFEKTAAWIRDHKNPQFVVESLKELLLSGFEFEPVNNIKVHAKVEQTTKMDKLSRWMDEVISRSILASAYCISALFAPLFIDVKKRLKDILVDKVVYSDGMTPQQMDSHASTFGGPPWVVTDDLEKQDAATTWLIINTEKAIYADLGVDPPTLDLYIQMHSKWKWKGRGMSGIWDAMRLTGQPTTAMGNAITNLIIHNRFYARNESDIVLMCILGDDNIIFSRNKLITKNHGTETKEFYNVVSKVQQRHRVGDYLGMIMHTLDGNIRVCPNFPRMRENFSVSNYTHLPDEREEKIDQRILSYCFMLGNAPNVKRIAASVNPIVTIPDWYNFELAIAANAMFYGVSTEQILNNVLSLQHMMMRKEVIESDQVHWSSDPNKMGSMHRILERKEAKRTAASMRVVLEDD